MTHTYQVSGITCASCVTKVRTLLEKIPGVTAVALDVDGQAYISMDRHIATATLQDALKELPAYRLSETSVAMPQVGPEAAPVSFWSTYKPILLVFVYILGTTAMLEVFAGSVDWMRWMRHFMAGFFLVFSFFKLLDIQAFAGAYRSYDIVAGRWPAWGYAYPFIELGLGLLFLLDLYPLATNALTFLVMGIGAVGVIRSLRLKRRLQCACLGAVFNLPMSNLTLFEDVLMVAMAGIMLFAQG